MSSGKATFSSDMSSSRSVMADVVVGSDSSVGMARAGTIGSV